MGEFTRQLAREQRRTARTTTRTLQQQAARRNETTVRRMAMRGALFVAVMAAVTVGLARGMDEAGDLIPSNATDAAGANATVSCPPPGFNSVENFNLSAWTEHPWYIQEQMPVIYQQPGDLLLRSRVLQAARRRRG